MSDDPQTPVYPSLVNDETDHDADPTVRRFSKDRPTATHGVPPFSCPVILEAERVFKASGDLRRAMNRLRKKLDHCAVCDEEGRCPVILELQDQIKAALTDLSLEWHLRP